MSLLPDTIQVGSIHYKIVYPCVLDSSSECFMGLHVPSCSEIRLAEYTSGGDKICEQSLAETLLHELLHAVDCVYCGHIFSENSITQLSFAVFQLLSDNDFRIINTSVKIGGYNFTVDFLSSSESKSSISWHSGNSTIKVIGTVNGKEKPDNYKKFLVFSASVCMAANLLQIVFPKLNKMLDTEGMMERIFCNGLYDTLDRNNLFKFFLSVQRSKQIDERTV